MAQLMKWVMSSLSPRSQSNKKCTQQSFKDGTGKDSTESGDEPVQTNSFFNALGLGKVDPVTSTSSQDSIDIIPPTAENSSRALKRERKSKSLIHLDGNVPKEHDTSAKKKKHKKKQDVLPIRPEHESNRKKKKKKKEKETKTVSEERSSGLCHLEHSGHGELPLNKKTTCSDNFSNRHTAMGSCHSHDRQSNVDLFSGLDEMTCKSPKIKTYSRKDKQKVDTKQKNKDDFVDIDHFNSSKRKHNTNGDQVDGDVNVAKHVDSALRTKNKKKTDKYIMQENTELDSLAEDVDKLSRQKRKRKRYVMQNNGNENFAKITEHGDDISHSKKRKKDKKRKNSDIEVNNLNQTEDSDIFPRKKGSNIDKKCIKDNEDHELKHGDNVSEPSDNIFLSKKRKKRKQYSIADNQAEDHDILPKEMENNSERNCTKDNEDQELNHGNNVREPGDNIFVSKKRKKRKKDSKADNQAEKNDILPKENENSIKKKCRKDNENQGRLDHGNNVSEPCDNIFVSKKRKKRKKDSNADNQADDNNILPKEKGNDSEQNCTTDNKDQEPNHGNNVCESGGNIFVSKKRKKRKKDSKPDNQAEDNLPKEKGDNSEKNSTKDTENHGNNVSEPGDNIFLSKPGEDIFQGKNRKKAKRKDLDENKSKKRYVNLLENVDNTLNDTQVGRSADNGSTSEQKMVKKKLLCKNIQDRENNLATVIGDIEEQDISVRQSKKKKRKKHEKEIILENNGIVEPEVTDVAGSGLAEDDGSDSETQADNKNPLDANYRKYAASKQEFRQKGESIFKFDRWTKLELNILVTNIETYAKNIFKGNVMKMAVFLGLDPDRTAKNIPLRERKEHLNQRHNILSFISRGLKRHPYDILMHAKDHFPFQSKKHFSEEELKKVKELHDDGHAWVAIAWQLKRSKDSVRAAYMRNTIPAKEKSTWQEEEQKRLVDAVNLELEEEKDIDWVFVSIKVATRDSKQCRSQWERNLNPSNISGKHFTTKEQKIELLKMIQKQGKENVTEINWRSLEEHFRVSALVLQLRFTGLKKRVPDVKNGNLKDILRYIWRNKDTCIQEKSGHAKKLTDLKQSSIVKDRI